MLLFVRFIITILKARFRSRIAPLEESVVHFTVLPHDCDLNMHLNAGRTICFMDVARIELLARMRVLRPAIRRGWRPLVGGNVVRYRRSVLPFERFAVRSRVLGWDDKWFYIEHLIERKDGSLAAVGTVRTLLRSGGRNVEPRELMELMNVPELQSPPLPPFVEQWRRAEDMR